MRRFMRSALAAAGVAAVCLAGLTTSADDASAAKAPASKAKAAAPGAPPSEADQQKSAAAATRQAYDAGVKSYSAGKFQPAVDQLSTALRGGGLASPEMAKALYVRGLAYKRLSKPGLAISDLTSALWLKNGLGQADQTSAMAERGEAYRMAGLGDGTSGADKVSVADPNPAPAGAKASVPVVAAPAATPAPVAAVPAAKSKSTKTAAVAPVAPVAAPAEVTRQSPDSESARDAAAARRNAAMPIETNGLQSAAVSTLVGGERTSAAAPVAAAAIASPPAQVALVTPSVPAPFPAPAAPAAPVLAAAPILGVPPAEPASPQPGVPGTVSGFFSNLFSGGSAATPPGQQVTTASTTPPPTASNWAGSTSVASGAAAKSSAVAPAAMAAPAAAKMPAGKYKLHIAAVRSRAEAEALAQKLSSQQGGALKSRMPVVDEAVIGSMGTFYRVRVGSFATPDESRGVCNSLRSSGFDCLVVTN